MLLHYSLANPSAFGPCPMGTRDYAQLGARATAAGMGAIALRVLDGGVLLRDPPPALAALAKDIGADLPALALRFALSNEKIAPRWWDFPTLPKSKPPARLPMRASCPPIFSRERTLYVVESAFAIAVPRRTSLSSWRGGNPRRTKRGRGAK